MVILNLIYNCFHSKANVTQVGKAIMWAGMGLNQQLIIYNGFSCSWLK